MEEERRNQRPTLGESTPLKDDGSTSSAPEFSGTLPPIPPLPPLPPIFGGGRASYQITINNYAGNGLQFS